MATKKNSVEQLFIGLERITLFKCSFMVGPCRSCAFDLCVLNKVWAQNEWKRRETGRGRCNMKKMNRRHCRAYKNRCCCDRVETDNLPLDQGLSQMVMKSTTGCSISSTVADLPWCSTVMHGDFPSRSVDRPPENIVNVSLDPFKWKISNVVKRRL